MQTKVTAAGRLAIQLWPLLVWSTKCCTGLDLSQPAPQYKQNTSSVGWSEIPLGWTKGPEPAGEMEHASILHSTAMDTNGAGCSKEEAKPVRRESRE